MNFWGRLKFFFGIIGVVVLVGLLVLYLNNAMSAVKASHAELGADSVNIGLDYPGTIVTQNVTSGDRVSPGQTLFSINSPQLTDAVNSKSVQVKSLPFTLDPKTQDILVKANNTGQIEKLNFVAGSYVPAGSVLAVIDTANTLYVTGHFNLSPPDYARVKKGSAMSVIFPDNKTARASVYSIALAQNGAKVDTVVKARLIGGTVSDFRFPVGTPVEASLKLSQRTWWQSVSHFITKLVKPKAQ